MKRKLKKKAVKKKAVRKKAKKETLLSSISKGLARGWSNFVASFV